MEELRLGSTGNNVRLLQRTLNTIYNENILEDGIFGNKTQSLLNRFKKDNNLDSTGVLDNSTFNILSKYVVVPTDIEYDYSVFIFLVFTFMSKYSFLDFKIIGNTEMDKNIYSIIFGNGKNNVIYVGGTHANEWITVPILMKYIEAISDAYINNKEIYGYNAKEIFEKSSIHFVPMLNPDGINLVINGISSAGSFTHTVQNIADSYPSIRFPSGWKANIKGIDINLQFPAGWNRAKEIKFEQGFTTPAPRDFVGNFPLEASEAIAIYDYIISNNFNVLLTYHSQGNVIYYKYLDFEPEGAYELGNKLATSSGYLLEVTPYESSFAGLKDWFIFKHNKPGYTIEVGTGVNPLPLSQFDEIYKDNIGILTIASMWNV